MNFKLNKNLRYLKEHIADIKETHVGAGLVSTQRNETRDKKFFETEGVKMFNNLKQKNKFNIKIMVSMLLMMLCLILAPNVLEATGILTDITPPTGTIEIVGNVIDGVSYVSDANVTLKLTASDNKTATKDLKMKIYNESDFLKIESLMNVVWDDFEEEVPWKLEEGDGYKVVYLILKDEEGNVSYNTSENLKAYTITFDTNGGNTISDIEAPAGVPISAPADPTREGYTFIGWDKEIPSTMPAEDLKIKANWKINKYTLTFDLDNGSEAKVITADYGTSIETPENPTKEGYNFVGWDKEIPATIPAENITIKAIWEAKEYEITFNTDGGSSISSEKFKYGETIVVNKTPTKEGYNFAGWQPSLPATMPAENLNVTATWTPRTDTEYAVFYFLENIGNTDYTYVTTDTKRGTTDATINISALAPATIENGTYSHASLTHLGEEAAEATIKGDGTTVIYLYYTRNKHELVVTGNENIASTTGSGTYKVGQKITIKATLKNDEGYTYAFRQWTSSNPSLVPNSYTESVQVTIPDADITMTAEGLKDAKQYNVTLNKNDGSGVVLSIPVTYGGTYENLPELEREGYSFAGWWTEATGGRKIEKTDVVTTNAEGQELYARWTGSTNTKYTVYHYLENIEDTNYTLVGSADEKYGTTDATISIATLAKDVTNGTYDFGSLTEGGAEATETTIKADGSTKIYLYYARNKYTLTVEAGNNIASTTGTESYKVGATVNISATLGNVAGYNYVFAGWTSDKTITINDTSSLSTKVTMPAYAVTVTATGARSVITYDISYDLAGGTVSGNPTTYNVETVSFTLKNPTKAGYTFAGWTGTGITGTSTNVTIAKGSTGARSYKATWTADTYYVTYDANGGTGAPEQQAFVFASQAPISTTVPTRTGYTFSHWKATHDGSKMNPGDKIPSGWGSFTLQAQWTIVNYTISYTKDSRLPDGYTLLDYIESSGTQYIDTGVVWDTNNLKFEGKYSYTELMGHSSILGTQGNVGNLILREESGKLTWYASSGGTQIATVAVGQTIDFKVDSTSSGTYSYAVLVNGGNPTAGSGTTSTVYDTNGRIFLFDTNYTVNGGRGSSAASTITCKAKLYAMKISKNGTLVRNFVPCLNASGVAGLYDLVEGKFYANAGTGSFEYSSLPAEYTELEYIESTGAQYIDTGYSAPDGFYGEVGFTYTEATGSYIVGSHNLGAPYGRNGIGLNGNLTWEIGTGDTCPASTNKPTVGKYYDLDFSTVKGNSYIDENGTRVVSTTDSTSRSSLNVLVFHNQYSKNVGAATAKGKLYYLRIYSSTKELVRNYIPAMNSSGVVGLYDTVGKTFYTNAGSGTFTAGPKYITTYNVESAAITIPTPVRDGYTFTGWTGSNGTTAQTTVTIPAGSTGNKNYKANWNTINYEITLNNVILPTGYTMLDYIQSTGTQWINSGVTIGANTWVNTDLMFDSAFDYNMMFGSWSDNFAVSLRAPNVVCAAVGGTSSQNIGSTTTYGVKYNIVLGPGKGYVQNGVTTAFGGASNTASGRTILLFGASAFSEDVPHAWNSFGVGKIYSFKIYNGTTGDAANSTLLRDFVPCINPSGTVGLYDMVNGVFYGNAGSGTFTAGNTVSSRSDKITYNIESQAIIVPALNITGYTFTGWTGTGLTSAVQTIAIPTGSTGNRSYTANYSVNAATYNIVYKSTSGKQLGTSTATYNIGTTNTISPKAFTGYTSPGNQSVAWDSATAKTITFTYTPIDYSITLNPNGGSVSSSSVNTITNLISNSNFETTTNWSGAVLDTSQKYIGNSSLKLTGTTVATIPISKPIVGHKYYGREYVKASGAVGAADDRFEIFGGDGAGLNWVIAHNSNATTSWGMLSNIVTIDSLATSSYTVRTFVVNASGTVWVDGVMLIDLTATFGAGNEPDLAWCNANIPYIEGTQYIKKYNIESAALTLPTVTKTGYTFTGWSGSGTGTSVTIASGSTGNKSYTANWSTNTNTAYTVKHYLMNLDGSTYALESTQTLYGTTGASVTPAVKSYTGFTAPSTQSVTIAANGGTVVEYKYTRNKYYLDLNGVLDGTSGGNISGYGTADIYVNGSKVATGVTDYYTQHYYGSTYEIKNIQTTTGHTYNGVSSGSASGTIGAANVSVFLSFSTNTYTNSISHWTWGYQNQEGNNSGKNAFHLGNTTFTGTYGNAFTLNTSNATTIPNGFYLQNTFGTSSVTGSWQTYNMGASITQTASAMSFEYDYYPNTYTITYNLNGGTNNSSNPTSYNVLYGVTLQNPTRTGYTFTGWTDQNGNKVTGINAGANASFASASDLYTKLSSRTTGNKTLTANWTPNKIKLTLNPNGGTGGTQYVWYYYGTSKFYSNEACTTQITAITRPTRTGYTYVNYHGDGTSGGTNGERYIAYDSIEFASDLATDIYKDATLYAEWSINTYTNTVNHITYGTGLPETTFATTTFTAQYGSTITLNGSHKTTIPAGTTVTHYGTAAFAGSWTSYYVANSNTVTQPAGGVTINLYYQYNTYTITTSAGANGTITPVNPTVTHGKNQTFKIIPNEGYQVSDVLVDGVSVKSSLIKASGGDVNKDGVLDSADAVMVLDYSQGTLAFTEEQILIADFDANGIVDTTDAELILSYCAEYDIKLYDNRAYIFTNVTANHTISATFTTVVYTITFDANGGQIVSDNAATTTRTATHGSTYGQSGNGLGMPTATRSGYALKGWYTAASGGTQVTSSTTVTARNHTLYAQWEVNTVECACPECDEMIEFSATGNCPTCETWAICMECGICDTHGNVCSECYLCEDCGCTHGASGGGTSGGGSSGSETCPECGHDIHNGYTCDGSIYAECRVCDGSGTVGTICTACGGDMEIDDYYDSCEYCMGDGIRTDGSTCGWCGGDGMLDESCRNCIEGYVYDTCSICNGNGYYYSTCGCFYGLD